jgi:predicted esterase
MVGMVREFIRSENYMPPSIIVSIENTFRNRDFLPTHNKDFPTSGEADNFLEFMKSELKPWVDEKCNTKGEDILLGHSFGGVLTIYTFLKEPELFSAYIAGDPSFWWDDGAMTEIAADMLPGMDAHGRVLFISGRSDGDSYAEMGIDKMDSLLNLHKPEDLYWKSTAYANESHGSQRLKNAYDGLRYIYEGFGSNRVEFHPMNGILLKGQPIRVWNASGNSNLHYTLDGSTPDKDSPKMDQTISIDKESTLKVVAISPRMNYRSGVLVGEFKEGKAMKPAKKLDDVKAGGLSYTLYEGKWEKIPDFNKLEAKSTGIMDEEFSLDKLEHREYFGIRAEGFIKIEEEGYYAFGIRSDDGAKFYLGKKELLDNDGLHAADSTKSFVLPLNQGFYPVRIDYFQARKDKSVDLYWLKPGENDPKPVPFEVMYH